MLLPGQWLAIASLLSCFSERPQTVFELDGAAFSAFHEWLLEGQVEIAAGLQFGIDPASGLRGLLATNGLAEGTQAFFVPKASILTPQMAREESMTWQQCREGDATQQDQFLASDQTAVALLLLEHRSVGAEWNPWVAVLPSFEEENAPLMFRNETELRGLHPSPMLKIAKHEQEDLAADYARVVQSWPELSWEEFKWARAVVLSRQFNVHIKDNGRLQKEVIMMVPLLDFVNHPVPGVADSNVRPVYDPDEGVYFMTTRAIKSGEGLFGGYGLESNYYTFQRWGFTCDSFLNTGDMPLFLSIVDHLGKAGNVRSAKMELIEEALQKGHIKFERDGSILHAFGADFVGQYAEKLLAHMRFIAFKPKSAAQLKAMCQHTYCKPIDAPSEQRALRKLVSILKSLVDTYPSSLENDKEHSQNTDPGTWSSTGQHIQRILLGEKGLMQRFFEFAKVLDPLFDLSLSALDAQIKQNLGDGRSYPSGIDKYITEVVRPLVKARAKHPKKKQKSGDLGLKS